MFFANVKKVGRPKKVENISTPTITHDINTLLCPRCKGFHMLQLRVDEWKCNDCGAGLSR